MNSIDWSAVVEAALAIFAFIGACISVWVSSRIDAKVDAAIETVRTTEIAPLKRALAAQHEVTAELKAMCAQQATREDFHKLGMQLEKALGEFKAMTVKVTDLGEEQKATRTSVQRVNDYLLNNKV